MLDSLHVKDLALIKETEIEFNKGLNILTGETGAGKSVIIGSVVLALGGKASKDLIRTGAQSALVELIFSIDNERVRKRCREIGIEPEDDMVVISRKISPTKTLSRVNGETVSLKTIKELSAVLLDVYGQHEHQTLTSEKVQAGILDDFCKDELVALKEKLKKEFGLYRELQKELNEAGKDSGQRGKELDLAAFEVNEIEAAALKPGEDTDLEEQYALMQNGRVILEALEAAHEALGGPGSPGNARDGVGLALKELKAVGDLDKDLEPSIESLSLIEEQLFDQLKFLKDHMRDLEFEPETYNEVSQRLDVINRLKDRYGPTIEAILAYRDDRQSLIEKYSDYDAYVERLTDKVNKSREKCLSLCKKMSDHRRKKAGELKGQMIEALSDLSFTQVEFDISIESDPDKMGYDGYDDVTWLISVNPGQELRPLSSIASGGELSRIMLGLKTVMAHNEDTNTLIFDEIDAGISGKTAWQVSKKLGILARDHQVICITHLPQIAAQADFHYMIEKKETDGVMGTGITLLDQDESVAELARLLGSDELSEAAIKNARDLKTKARKEY